MIGDAGLWILVDMLASTVQSVSSFVAVLLLRRRFTTEVATCGHDELSTGWRKSVQLRHSSSWLGG